MIDEPQWRSLQRHLDMASHRHRQLFAQIAVAVSEISEVVSCLRPGDADPRHTPDEVQAMLQSVFRAAREAAGPLWEEV